ncbi:uncharacterized protein TNCV_1206191 [Trichonephila clavipes]|nr:uncharacterized protein TNCV_1206191 [Trichonephila clavipes]
MEVAGALSIFQRSQSLYNVRYTKYLGDGDSKAFTSIVENKVYGDHCSVEKLECIDTWCKFKKAELLGETYHHKNSLPVDVVEAMRPVFRDLANPELLKKCLHGGTQNPNESVNNVIWSRVPKKTFVQLEVLSLSTYDAVSSFNMGNVSKLEILRKMCIEPGDYTVQAMECLDKQRLLRAKYYCLQKQRKLGRKKDLKGRKKMMSY